MGVVRKAPAKSSKQRKALVPLATPVASAPPPPSKAESDAEALAGKLGAKFFRTLVDETVGDECYWESSDHPAKVHKAVLNWMNKIMSEPRLVQLKGVKDRMAMFEVVKRRDSLNSNDVFILDAGNVQYVWFGKNSNQYEQKAAVEVVKYIRSSRGPNTHHTILKEGKSDDCAAFWKEIRDRPLVLGFSNYLSPKLKVRSKDVKADEDVKPFVKKLYALNNHNGTVTIQRRWLAKTSDSLNNQFSAKKLESKRAFLLDDGMVLWAWIGSDSGVTEDLAIEQACKYLQRKSNHVWYKRDHDRPVSLPVKVVRENSEPKQFLQNFKFVRKSRDRFFKGL